MLKYHVIVEGAFAHNTVILWESESREAFLLDPGSRANEISRFIECEKLQVKAVILTHAHLDHVGGLKHFMNYYGVDFFMHPNEASVLEHVETSCRMYGLPVFDVPESSSALSLKEGDKLELGKAFLKVIETPGHTPGGVCFYSSQGLVFVGDTLFSGSVGRTDLPGGDFPTLQSSLRKLVKLPAETVVVCGHGPDTSIGIEKSNNPFLADLF